MNVLYSLRNGETKKYLTKSENKKGQIDMQTLNIDKIKQFNYNVMI